ncbi:hypothetical protein RB195_025323 [Necator americanus]|uniref:Reverse transcriptase domain-containing protein n=1 Tax=Necator americanus TaxID=51031 RepID=A0ABR1ERU2_NECAM
MGVKVDDRYLQHLRFADDIVLITRSINQAERMLAEFYETCKKIGFRLNLDKTMFVRNGWVSDAPFTRNGMNISECSSYVYLGSEINIMNDRTFELGRRKRVAFKRSIQGQQGCSEEDQEHPVHCSPLQHRISCFDQCF